MVPLPLALLFCRNETLCAQPRQRDWVRNLARPGSALGKPLVQGIVQEDEREPLRI